MLQNPVAALPLPAGRKAYGNRREQPTPFVRRRPLSGLEAMTRPDLSLVRHHEVETCRLCKRACCRPLTTSSALPPRYAGRSWRMAAKTSCCEGRSSLAGKEEASGWCWDKARNRTPSFANVWMLDRTLGWVKEGYLQRLCGSPHQRPKHGKRFLREASHRSGPELAHSGWNMALWKNPSL